MTASGVSSTMMSTPVATSRARMFRPSRPMIRPFMSSLGRSTTETVDSTTCSAADRWMAPLMISAASWRLLARVSSSIRLTDLDGFEPGLVLDLADDLGLGLVLGHPGDALELGHLLLDDLVDLLLLVLDLLLLLEDAALLGRDVAVAAVESLDLAVEVLFLVDETALGLVELAAFVLGLVLELGVGRGELLAGLVLGLADDLVGLALGLVDDAVGFLLGPEQSLRPRALLELEDEDRRRQDYQNGQADIKTR